MTITVLDGGMGGELQRRFGTGDGLWSAQVLVDNPDGVAAVHMDYIAAGARMIITNTYSTIPSYLGKEGRESEYVELTRLGGEIARRAVKNSGVEVRILGSLPPLSESYRPDLVPAAEQAMPIYRNMAKALVDNVDAFVCETMSSADEALHASSQALLHGQGKPVYVSWTLNETPGAGLRSLESVTHAFETLAHLEIAGFMFNCTRPEAIEAALVEITSLTDKPVGCYANRIAEVPLDWELDKDYQTIPVNRLPTALFVEFCLRCAAKGATIIGGCCGIGPEDISALSEALQNQKGLA